MSPLELFVFSYRPDLVSLVRNSDGSYTIGQVEGEDLPRLEEIIYLADLYTETRSPEALLKASIGDYIAKGAQIMQRFIMENLVLGITESNMTGPVRKKMSEVMSALQSGALLDAIAEMRAIPVEDKDAVFITDARILSYINEIEAFAGLPLSESV